MIDEIRHAHREASLPSEDGQRSLADERRQKLSYTVQEFCVATGLGKTSIFEAIKVGELKSVYVAGRRLILREDGEAWLKAGRDVA